MKKGKLSGRGNKKLFSFNSIIILFILSLALTTRSVSAVECGSVPIDNCDVTQNTTFNMGNYSLPNGINIKASGITLNCNDSMIIGTQMSGSKGIELFGNYDSNIIKNCKSLNYSFGMYFSFSSTGAAPNYNYITDNILELNTYGAYVNDDADSNTVINNLIQNNTFGVYFAGNTVYHSEYNNITQNIFINNTDSDVYISGPEPSFNNVWNNTVYNKIFYTHTGNTNYVINGAENIYIGYATGPTSQGLYIYNKLIVNSNRNYKPGAYIIPDWVEIRGGSLTFDCNNSITIKGTAQAASYGILLYGNSDLNVITNCLILNYTYGISFLDGGTGLDPENNKIISNRVEQNTYGIYFRGDASYNNLTNNIIKNDTVGIYLKKTTSPNAQPEYNNIFFNNFINNTNRSIDEGANNNWNASGQGNYWDNYDEESEGCFDTNDDLICDTPYNISGSAGAKDYLPLLGIQILDIIPIQVIRDVDLVKGKTTLVRSTVQNFGVLDRNITIKLYFDDNLKNSVNTTINASQQRNIDLFFIPDAAGNSKEIRVEVNETV